MGRLLLRSVLRGDDSPRTQWAAFSPRSLSGVTGLLVDHPLCETACLLAPPRFSPTNRFRARRGRVLRAQIDALIARAGRPITILDVGGLPDYWLNVGTDGIDRIVLVNRTELGRPAPESIFDYAHGDARNLEFGDLSFDLVHSNSVIEHVGGWNDMTAMAEEVRRVGGAGWVQTPAWSFPIEPHLRAPFLHWFAQPVRRRMMSISAEPYFRSLPLEGRRVWVDRTNLLTRAELQALFPSSELYIERFAGLAKSYSAHWM